MHRHLVIGLAVVGAGCGESDPPCGTGTVERDGMCVSTASTVCGDGTKLVNGQCVVDPAACQAGTVLIANRCVDPTSGLTVDLEASDEPNGMAIAVGVEASALPAGTIVLKPAGQAVVLHSTIAPFRDADSDGQFDADFDTYVITVDGATLLEVSVDGVGGAQGAFYVAGDRSGPLAAYERYGLNLTGDTSKRRLFLPVAGRYLLAIADTRTLGVGRNPPPPAGVSGAAGGPAAAYYASITVVPVPAPTAIQVTAGLGSHSGVLATDEVQFFTAAMGTGSNQVVDVMPGAAAASVAVVNAGAFKAYADENLGTMADVTIAGIQPGDAPLIAVDAAYNYGPAPEPFMLTITQR